MYASSHLPHDPVSPVDECKFFRNPQIRADFPEERNARAIENVIIITLFDTIKTGFSFRDVE